MSGDTLLMWAFAVLALVAVNTQARDPDAKGLSLAMVFIWAISTVLVCLYTPPESMRLFPVMDLLGGLTALLGYRRRPALWKRVAAHLFFIQCLVHVAFWAHQVRDDWVKHPTDLDTVGVYVALLNVTTGLLIACLAFPGVHDVGSRVLSSVRRASRHRVAPSGR